ncbi:methyl-accepting chemotaxis protein [Thermovenabulum gondwanense]|uniref:Methyl-accepting chemotaxis protein 4 n=1 Tax=Thermovenabulum gondwanense TaxID=520767 RepID=A0A162N3V7_9FIRM|nr:methyl-accepting chemotaxis protein [Thermovenabulum gondwanense]KYO69176.1 Methyl-accepting chemotaxis protein 4 [Thermovenabulum gondwanense]
MNFKSVKFKINILPLFVIFLLILSISLTSGQIVRSRMIAQMENDGYNLANQIAEQIQSNARSMEIINGNVEGKIKEVAGLIINNKKLINNQYLENIARSLNVDEINVVDNTGKIVYSNLKENIGYVYDEKHAAQKLLKGEVNELMEEIRKSTVNDNYYKYGYVKTPEGGFIQIGLLATTVQKLFEDISYQKLIDTIAIKKGVVYALIMDNRAKVLASSDKEEIGQVLTDTGSQTAAVKGMPYASTYFDEKTNKTVYDVLVPLFVNGKHIGAVDIGLSMDEVNSTVKNTVILIILIGLVGFITVGIILHIISSRVVQAVHLTAKHIENISKGDFTLEIPEKYLKMQDEFGNIMAALEKVKDNFRSITLNLRESSNTLFSNAESLSAASQEMAASTGEVAKTIQEVANGASQQAQDMQEVVGSLENISKNMGRLSDLVKSIRESSKTAEEKATNGKDSLKALYGAFDEIRTSFTNVLNKISNLTQSLLQISEINEVITGISQQTNLLALNAAIEAARAGEVGRGFAVVASEIRKLAEESKVSSDRIKKLIETIKGETGEVYETTENTGKMVTQQLSVADHVVKSLDEIIDSVNNMIPLIDNAYLTMDEVMKMKDEVLTRAESVSSVIQETSASAEEISASAQELSASTEEIAASAQTLTTIAKEISESMQRFKV